MRRRQGFGIAIVWAVTSAAFADQALVVGIDKYDPHSRVPALSGCAADMAKVAAALGKVGFNVVQIQNDKATEEVILQNLRAMVEHATGGERIVFYFNGHGARNGGRGLCAYDYDPTGSGSKHIVPLNTVAELLKPAAAKGCFPTVLVDSCFAGGADNPTTGSGRVYSKYAPQAQSKDPRPVSEIDPMISPGPVCFFTACQPNESAANVEIDGQYTGVFTHCLLPLVESISTNPMSWQKAESRLIDQSDQILEENHVPQSNRQRPCLTPGFENVMMFQDPGRRVPIEPPKTAADAFTLLAPDANGLSVHLDPDLDFYLPGQRIKCDVSTDQADVGYLVIIGRIGKHYFRTYPDKPYLPNDTGKVVLQAKINKDNAISKLLQMDDAEGDDLKFLWFRHKEPALSLIKVLPVAGTGESGLTFAEMLSKDVQVASSIGPAYFTFDRHLRARDLVFGGGEISSPEKVVQKLRATSSLTTRLRASGFPLYQGQYSDADIKATAIRPDYVTFLVNTLLDSDDLLLNVQAFADFKLPGDLAKELAETVGQPAASRMPEKVRALNRRLLRVVFPDEIDWEDSK